jgi:hypothetical protein
MRATVQAGAAGLLLAVAAASPAAGAGERAELVMPFSVVTPSTESGLRLDVRYLNPRDREAKPPAITKVVLRLPEGTRIDPSAAPVCEATNEELQARGRDACPAESKVGEGKLEAYTGAPNDPVRTDLTLFNGPDQIVELVSFEGTNATAGIDRLTIEGNVLTGAPPFVPGGPPDGRTAVSRITWDVPARGSYLVTPPTCDGVWRVVGEFGFADGGETTVTSEQPCERGAAPVGGDRGGAPEGAPLRVTASPRRVRRGRVTAVGVRVEGDTACVRGAIVRVGRRAARTDDAGRATIRALVRWARPLAHVRVTSPCGRARAALRVRD